MYIGKQYNILIFRDITKENVHAPYFYEILISVYICYDKIKYD